MDAYSLIKQKIEINRLIESLGGFSQDMQVLFLVGEGYVTPKTIMQQTGILKTNLSIICKKLIDAGLLSKMTSEDNKKLVAYCLTIKGKHKVTNTIKEMNEKYENL